jgi:hypothetical protein
VAIIVTVIQQSASPAQSIGAWLAQAVSVSTGPTAFCSLADWHMDESPIPISTPDRSESPLVFSIFKYFEYLIAIESNNLHLVVESDFVWDSSNMTLILQGVQKVPDPLPSRRIRLLTGILISNNIKHNSGT